MAILFTLEVSKLYKFKEINDMQLENILDIIVTLDVLKLDKSKETKDEHP